MRTSIPKTGGGLPRIRLRRPPRPVAVLVAVLVGLGGLGGAAGAVLGELGAAHSGPAQAGRHDHGHRGDDGPGAPFER